MANAAAGKRIRELREMHNYTREGFAEKIQISSKFLYEIETGKKGFSAEILCRISNELSVSCDYIMFGEEKEHKSVQRIARALEGLKPFQLRRILDMLQMFCDMWDSRTGRQKH